jgi:hypothetical protein
VIETEAFESFLRDLTLSRDMNVVIAASELLEALEDERAKRG